jgi:ATP-dependent RNA helicase DeaD
LKAFSELVLSAPVMHAINELKFETPTPIQAQALPILLSDPTDFIGLAATGTGKTAAFAIPLIERADSTKKSVQALVLCPTRELALQVAGQINLLGKTKGITAVPVYGGASYGEQIRGLKEGRPIIVGTPGRIIDHLERGTLKLNDVQVVVLDEADEMISMGFKEAMEKILQSVPRETSNIWLFSATMSQDVRRVANKFLVNPQQVQVNRTEMLSNTVEQIFYAAREGNKPDILCKLIDSAEDFYGLVFCQTKALVTHLTQLLTERGYKVDCLHGDKNQNERERSMHSFRTKRITILVCTDVASRGLDVKDISHVINYSIPRELELYVHRIGRTARSGKKGIAMSLVTPSHRNLIAQIEKMTRSKIKEGVLPTRKDVGIRKSSKILEDFKIQKNFAKALELLDEEWQLAILGMSREEIIARFLNMSFPELFEEKAREKVVFSREGQQPHWQRKKWKGGKPGSFHKRSKFRD